MRSEEDASGQIFAYTDFQVKKSRKSKEYAARFNGEIIPT